MTAKCALVTRYWAIYKWLAVISWNGDIILYVILARILKVDEQILAIISSKFRKPFSWRLEVVGIDLECRSYWNCKLPMLAAKCVLVTQYWAVYKWLAVISWNGDIILYVILARVFKVDAQILAIISPNLESHFLEG